MPFRPSACLLLLTGALTLSAQPPAGYYDPAAGLTGEALRNALYEIISPHTVHLYSQLWADFPSTDERDNDPDQVWDIYSDDPGGPEPYVYTFGADQCSGNSPTEEAACYNREHSMPQDWFNGEAPMESDLFHIYPTDAWVNQKRGNLPYGKVGSTDFVSENGTKTGTSITPGYSGDVCEPIDAYKGDLARTYFYMLTRYMPNASSWSGDMLAGGNFSNWAEDLLVEWSDADPVSPKEVERNNDIYAIQQNRNPYIDNPQWVHYIWGPTAAVDDLQATPNDLRYVDGTLLRASSTASAPLLILNAEGRCVFSAEFKSSRFELPELPQGFYVARVNEAVLRFVR